MSEASGHTTGGTIATVDQHTAPLRPRLPRRPTLRKVAAVRTRTWTDPRGQWLLLPHERRAYWVTKRCIDVAGSLAILAIFGIPMLLFALLIKLDDPKGPIFFRQTRSGLGGRRFELLKFSSRWRTTRGRPGSAASCAARTWTSCPSSSTSSREG
jgi:lipopolysaccharide/colanic/teichoic acid biosynthesis glycosyltransferase